jgi:hypothetical protein
MKNKLFLLLGMAMVIALIPLGGADASSSQIFSIGDYEPGTIPADGNDEFSQTGWRGEDYYRCNGCSASDFPAGIIAPPRDGDDSIHDRRGVPRVEINFNLDAEYRQLELRLAKYGVEDDRVFVDGSEVGVATGGTEGVWSEFKMPLGNLPEGPHKITIKLADPTQGNGAHLWDSISLTGDRDPTGTITSPTADARVSGDLVLGATYLDDNPPDKENVQWAVREGNPSCTGTTKAGNVGGFNDGYSWTGTGMDRVFAASVDTSGWDPGDYCFVFNPREEGDEPNVRLVRQFTVDQDPTGVITSPKAGAIVFKHLTLGATYTDDNPPAKNGVQWAVREGNASCTGTTKAGNVGGFNDAYSWTGTGMDRVFAASVDTSGWAGGDYCFVFNPKEEGHEPDVRLVRQFKIADGIVNGGGQLREGDGKNPLKISFGGKLYRFGSDLECEWQVRFHNVGDDEFDKTKFHGETCTELNVFDPGPAEGVVNFKVEGEFEGASGYTLLFRMEDRGEPGRDDTIRIELWNGTSKTYDTHNSGEFTDESNNVGNARTGLDKGNIEIDVY